MVSLFSLFSAFWNNFFVLSFSCLFILSLFVSFDRHCRQTQAKTIGISLDRLATDREQDGRQTLFTFLYIFIFTQSQIHFFLSIQIYFSVAHVYYFIFFNIFNNTILILTHIYIHIKYASPEENNIIPIILN